MIRNCEDIKTIDEFCKFAQYRQQGIDIGLYETANMIAWNQGCLISPELFDILKNQLD